MKQWIVRLVTAGSLLLPVTAMPLTQEDFLVKTTRDLLNLCSATADDPMQKESYTHVSWLPHRGGPLSRGGGIVGAQEAGVFSQSGTITKRSSCRVRSVGEGPSPTHE